jgi:hypothetical protein
MCGSSYNILVGYLNKTKIKLIGSWGLSIVALLTFFEFKGERELLSDSFGLVHHAHRKNKY